MKHVTRYSDSSLYDSVCILCGATDVNETSENCPVTDPLVRAQLIQAEEERAARRHAQWVEITGGKND